MKKSTLVILGFALVLMPILTGCADESGNANQAIEPGQAQAPSAPNAAGAGSGPTPGSTSEAQLGE